MSSVIALAMLRTVFIFLKARQVYLYSTFHTLWRFKVPQCMNVNFNIYKYVIKIKSYVC